MIIDSYNWYILNRENLLNSNKEMSIHKSRVKQGVLYLIGKLL